jgi:hypothetical protein
VPDNGSLGTGGTLKFFTFIASCWVFELNETVSSKLGEFERALIVGVKLVPFLGCRPDFGPFFT